MAKYLDLDGLAYYKSKEDLLLANKVDKETGKGLSTNDYTTAEKTKLSGIETAAEVNVLEGVQLNGITITPTNKIANIEINIPTSTSELTNDSGFITNTVNNLTNYYTKTNTYTKSEVDSLIDSVISLDIQIVQTLPTRDISTSTIYLVPKTASTNDNYDEYIYVNNSWEPIGSTEIDLSNYYTKTQTDNLLDDKADSSDIPTKVSDLTNDVGYSTFSGSYNDLTNKPTIPTKTSDLTNDSGFVDNTYHDSSKQDTLVSGTNIKTINNTSLLGSGNISISGGENSFTAGAGIDITNGVISNTQFSGSTTQAEGTNVTIENTIEGPISSELKGDSYQETTTGSTLSDFNNLDETINDLNIKWNENNTLTLNGSYSVLINNSKTERLKNSVTLKAGTTYYLHARAISGNYSVTNANNANIAVALENSTSHQNFMRNSITCPKSGTPTFLTATYTPSEDVIVDAIRLFVQYAPNDIVYNNFKIQYCLTTDTTPKYEEYTGGIASPNPDYPQEVETVTGNQEIVVCGKNIFDGILELGSYSGSSGEKVISINTYRNANIIQVKPNTTYTFSINGTKQKYVLLTYGLTQNFKQQINDDTGTFTTASDVYYINFRSYQSDFTSNYANLEVQLEESQSYPINLGDIELCKIGDYQDRIYKDSGKWYLHKDIGKVVLDGDNKRVNYNNVYNNIYQFSYLASSSMTNFNPNEIYVFTNFFKRLAWSGNWTIDNSSALQNSGHIRFNTSKFDNANDFNLWLTTHNLIAYYVLATPTTTEITDTTLISQLNALASARSYKGQTNISVDGDLPVILDLEAYINNIPTKTSDLTNDSGYITTETDPVFSSSVASNITSTNISTWNNKLDTSKVKSSSSTTSGDVYDVTYINTMLGDIETILTTLTTGNGV